jgi:hypothetical protein
MPEQSRDRRGADLPQAWVQVKRPALPPRIELLVSHIPTLNRAEKSAIGDGNFSEFNTYMVRHAA